jgi:hypothetical protein
MRKNLGVNRVYQIVDALHRQQATHEQDTTLSSALGG